MIEENHNFPCPPNHRVLWRYMNLSAFITLLDEKALYFSRLDEFEDKWEGSPPMEYLLYLHRLGSIHKQECAAQQLLLTESVKKAAVSCWHMNDHESVAMWKLYTKGLDGVAIATTVGRLKDVLQKDSRRFVIGQVSYGDEGRGFKVGADVEIDPLRSIFEKRLSYEHEREVRVVCTNAEPPPDLRETEAGEYKLRGVSVPVDLDHLVMSIVVAEHYPTWALYTLQKLIDYEHKTLTIQTSDLPCPPYALSDFKPR